MRVSLNNVASEASSGIVTIVLAALISAVIIAIFILGAPQLSDLQDYKIAPEEVIVLPHEGSGPFRRSRVNEDKYNLHTAAQIPIKTRRQYTYTFRLQSLPMRNGETYMPYVGGPAVVYMNGVRVGETQEFLTRFAGFARHYIRADIPQTSYQTGVNRLIVVMTPDRSYAGIPAVYYGYEGMFSNAENRHNQRHFFVRNILLFTGLAAIFLSLLGFSFRRRIKPYIYIFALSFGLALLSYFMRNSVRLTFDNFQLLSGIVYGLIIICLGGLFMDKQLRRNPYLLGLWITAALSIIVSIGLLVPFSRPLQTQSLAYFALSGTVPFLAFFCIHCLREDHGHFRQSQIALEEKLAKQKNIIAAREAELENALKAKGRLEERQRLTRDIHDGIGGQLLSLLVRVRDGGMSQAEIENDLQYGLNDLRLIVDSMDHSEGSLETAFVTFRARAEAQLKATGVEFKWRQSDPFEETVLGPAGILNIYRLMQEAVSNAIRHAKCNQIKIDVSRTNISEPLVIAIEDDGVGFDAETKRKTGQGLKNMQYRAKALRGELQISESSTGGTKITLTISVEPEEPSLI